MAREVRISKIGDATTFQIDGEGGGIEGFGMASLDENGRLVVDSIHVINKSRRGGLGGSILTAIKNFGKANAATDLTGDFFPEFRGGIDEKAAREFYLKHGIEITDDNKLIGKL